MRFDRPILFLASCFLAIVFSSIAGTSSVSAQPIPALKITAPIYVRRGESRTIELPGENLAMANAAALADANGLTAELIPPVKPNAPLSVKLSATPDAVLGDRELRIITTNGITQPLVVNVGQYPLIVEKEPNNSPEAAQSVVLPACIAGKIDVAGDVDFFRFEAKSGAHLLFDIYAARAGSPLQPVLTIYDAAGRELPHQMEDHAGDPLLIFDAPADGAYLLQVRDLQYRGGGDFNYRVEAGAIPYIESLEPMSGRPGSKIDITARGHNLKDAAKITLDLTGKAEGPIRVRAAVSGGLSNEAVFLVSPSAQVDRMATGEATVQSLPFEIAGVLEHPNDVHSIRFRVAAKQQVTLAMTARAIHSPLDALLMLKTAAGDLIEQSNGTPDTDARISRSLEPGEYQVSLRDLTFAGGPSYAYRLSVGAADPPPDFALRFAPDTARVARGGHTKLWCEVTRKNGFAGAVNISIDGLPTGASAGAVKLDENASGIFTIAAAADAPIGTYPIRIEAAGVKLVRAGEPEMNARVVQQAYLTITEAAPITVEGEGILRPQQLTDYARQVTELNQRLNAQTPQLVAAQTAWEKQFDKPDSNVHGWKVLDLSKLASAGGTAFTRQGDGSVRAGGPAEADTYTITTSTDVKGIAAFRLEAMSDPSLPTNGPGRAPNGNFVVGKFQVSAAPKGKPAEAKAIVFKGATSTFEQGGYPAPSAIGAGTGGGWAIAPETGKSQAAVFLAATPVGFEGGTELIITLDQRFGTQHMLGRFRLSVSSDPKAKAEVGGPSIPESIIAIVKTPFEKRTAAQQKELAAFYRSVSPELAVDRARLDDLKHGIGPYAEMANLAARIKAVVPGLGRMLRTLLPGHGPDLPLLFRTARNRTLAVPVPIHRTAGFTGDVQVTLEGFSAGRDPATRLPAPIARNFVVAPLVIKGPESFGTLSVKINPNSEIGTRMVVLRAETKVGNDTWVQYSPAFSLTVTEK